MSSTLRTAQAGVAYVTWQLPRRDWDIQPSQEGSKRSTLITIKKEGVSPALIVQSRAFSKQDAVRLGDGITDPSSLRFDWLAITTYVRSDAPICFLLNRIDVMERMKRDPMGPLYWVDPPRYIDQQFKDRWDQISPV